MKIFIQYFRLFRICLPLLSVLTMSHADSSKDLLLIEYSHKPKPFTWRVNDRAIGNDFNKVIEIASAANPREVIARSEKKMVIEETDRILAALKRAKLHVKEFWVPVSDFGEPTKTPGWVDLLNPS